jgi:periplasmic divalent cation tolerance protein
VTRSLTAGCYTPWLLSEQEVSVTEMLVVFTSFASEDDAARVVRALVEERLIACGNLVPGARSLYRWEGKLADEREVLVLMKTRKQDWTALLSRLHELHPYETPECLAIRVAAGAPKYMAWLEAALAPEA